MFLQRMEYQWKTEEDQSSESINQQVRLCSYTYGCILVNGNYVQIWISHSISKTALVTIYQRCSKGGEVIIRRLGDGQPRIICIWFWKAGLCADMLMLVILYIT